MAHVLHDECGRGMFSPSIETTGIRGGRLCLRGLPDAERDPMPLSVEFEESASPR